MNEIADIIRSAIRDVPDYGKIGKSTLQPTIANALIKAGFDVDLEDSRSFLGAGKPVWRSKDTNEIEVTRARRLIDIVVRDTNRVVALIETESDLDDLRESGASRRSGHYDVWSIARDKDGNWFNSYKSLERMAAAVWYSASGSIEALQNVRSNEAVDHNPAGVMCCLVTGRSRTSDRRILLPRLNSLNAELFSAQIR